MINPDELLRELVSTLGYAEQTLRLHPEKSEQVQRYLKSVKLTLANKMIESRNDPDILRRVVVW